MRRRGPVQEALGRVEEVFQRDAGVAFSLQPGEEGARQGQEGRGLRVQADEELREGKVEGP